MMIVAGEASGDLHGADLAEQILARDPKVDLFGIAGERMRAVGVRALVKTEDIAGMGAAELISTLRRTLWALRMLRSLVRRDPPDLVILIDYAEFNMMLARISATGRCSGALLHHAAGMGVAARTNPQAGGPHRSDGGGLSV